MSDILKQLERVLQERRQADPETSYVAGLYAGGINRILEKVGEEATEVILAAKDHAVAPSSAQAQEVVHEIADLWFHTLVMLAHYDLPLSAVEDELASRFGLSGLTEKAQRHEKLQSKE